MVSAVSSLGQVQEPGRPAVAGPHSDLGLGLDGHAGDLAVALGPVGVADGDQGALDVVGQAQGRPGAKGRLVDVAQAACTHHGPAQVPWSSPAHPAGDRRLGVGVSSG